MPEIQMPKLSDTMSEGTLVAWKKKKGDQVSAGEVPGEVESERATMEWESPEDGTLTEIYVQEGGKVNVGDRIAFIGGEDEEAPEEEEKEKENEEKEEKPKAKEEEKKEEKPTKTEQPKEETPTTEEKKEKKAAPPKAEKKAEPEKPAPKIEKAEEARVKASPVARRIAAELGVELSSVNGTGPEGRVTETDGRAAAKSKSATPATKVPATKVPAAVKAGESARIQLSGMRKIIAQRLVESLGPVPHFYLNIDIDAGPLMEARDELKSAGEGADAAKITVNDFVLKAAVQAAVKIPRINASFDGDAIVQYADVDLGMAVAIEDGLLTPVIRAAQNKSLREISELAKDFAHRARNKRMKPEEFQGGTFTVSNLGGMGIDS